MKILIAVALHDGRLWAETGNTITFLLSTALPGVQFEYRTFAAGGIAVARNELAHIAKQEKFAGILFIDSDIIGKPSDALGVMSHGVHICGGLYPKKHEKGFNWCCNFKTGAIPSPKGLLEVDNVGGGWLFVTISALNAIETAFPELGFEAGGHAHHEGFVGTMFNYFVMGVYDRTYLTEDFGLAYLARKAGLKVYVDTNIRLDHMGSFKWAGRDERMPEPWKS